MQNLIPWAEKVARLLTERKETIAVAELSTGGLISAALLTVPGASAYYLGGAVLYTQAARKALLDVAELPNGMRASTEAYALFAAKTVRQRFSASWALVETGAAGPTGNRYGDAPGHTCIAVVGRIERAMTLETGIIERAANMRAFATAAFELLTAALSEK